MLLRVPANQGIAAQLLPGKRTSASEVPLWIQHTHLGLLTQSSLYYLSSLLQLPVLKPPLDRMSECNHFNGSGCVRV